jgi:hypothetical protein
MIIDEEEMVVEEEVLEETETPEVETPEEEETEVETEETSEEEEDEDDRIVSIGEPEESEEDSEEEEEHQEAPGWVKKVRKVNREQEREIKRLKKQLEEKNAPPEEEIKLGDKPTLESSGFDDKKFEKDLLEWHELRKKVEAKKAKEQKIVEEQNKAWQNKQKQYVSLKEKHNFKDFSDAESVVADTLDVKQQGILVQGADDPALLVYALGKNPKKLEELASINDPVVLAFKLAKLEAQLKVTSKKAPAPEKRVSGGKTSSGRADKTLEKLREKANKSGDFTELNRYKKKLRGAK